MNAKEVVRLPDPRQSVKAEVSEIIRDMKGRPHLFTRVRLTGWNFPHRAPEPFVMIGRAASAFVLIDRTGSSADAFFEVYLPDAKTITFGYGNIATWDFPVSIVSKSIKPLDRERLPKEIFIPKAMQKK